MNWQKAIAVLVLIAIVVGVVGIIALIVNTFICNNCLLGGPGAQPQNSPVTGMNVGLKPQIYPDDTPVFTSFENASSRLSEIPGLALDENDRPQVTFIQGQNVDENGWAAKWLFEVKSTGGTELRVVDRHGLTVIPWNVTSNMEDISIGTVITPSALFSKNRLLILKNGPVSPATSREIELRGTVYTLTSASAGVSKVMTFDAATGALIE